MKICPNCKSVNGDENKFCSECSKYIKGVEIIADDGAITRAVDRASKREFHIKVTAIIIFTIIYAAYNVWAIFMNLKLFGNIDSYLALSVWYIPCIILFFFPYDLVYTFCKSKFGKNKQNNKHLSDFVLMGFRSIAVLMLIWLYIKTYDILAYTKIVD